MSLSAIKFASEKLSTFFLLVKARYILGNSNIKSNEKWRGTVAYNVYLHLTFPVYPYYNEQLTFFQRSNVKGSSVHNIVENTNLYVLHS